MLTSAFGVVSAQAISKPADLDITDITHLQKGIAGFVELDAETIRTYDVNGDGEIDITEVTFWQKVLAGMIVLDEAPTKLSLNTTSETLGVGETLKLVPSSDCSNVKVTYSSNNTKVATATLVDGKCKVTAKASGTATITVTLASGAKATCNVTVNPMATSVTLNKTSLTIGVGETFDFNSSIPSGTAAIYRNFYSNNTSIATIKKSGGVMTAVKAGTTTIYVELNNGVRASCTVNVKPMATSVSFAQSEVNVMEGKTYTLKTSIPSGTAALNKTFSSSCPEIVSVNSNGVVTAKKYGTATISVRLSNGKSAYCNVTVKVNTENAERKMETLINQYRKQLGLKTLAVSTNLQKAAGKRAVEASQLFSHTRPNGTLCFTVLDEYNIYSSFSGECLAGYSGDPQAILNSWKNSPGHNDIITGKGYTHMAVGCYEKNNYYYWVYFAITA